MISWSEVKEVILTISASVSMVSIAIGIYTALGQYRLKLKEEERLALSTHADVDIRLLKSFTELMDLAMGRRQHVLSEKAIEELFKLGVISKDDFDENFEKRQNGSIKISENAVVVLPVGRSAQSAAIAAISTLGKKYPVLKEAAIEGLTSLLSIKDNDVVKRHLEDLQSFSARTKAKRLKKNYDSIANSIRCDETTPYFSWRLLRNVRSQRHARGDAA